MKNKRSICSIITLAKNVEWFLLPALLDMSNGGWEVTIITNMTDELKSQLPNKIKWYHVPMEKSTNVSAAIKSQYKILRILLSHKYTIVQYGTLHASLYGSIAAFLSRVPIRIYLQWGVFEYEKMGLQGVILKLLAKLICSLSTDIRAVSKKNLAIAESYDLFPKGKGKVLGEGGTIGVDLSLYKVEDKNQNRRYVMDKYQIDSQCFIFGFLGRLTRDKGIAELLEAFKKLNHEYPMTRLLMVGDYEESFDKISLSKWAKTSENIVFTGAIPHNFVQRYTSAFDVMVHPTYREGFGLVLQEAMALQIPIITTDIPGPSEVIEDGVSGVLVPPKDARALYEKMKYFYLHIDECRQYGVEGRKRVEKYFSRPVMIKNMIEDKELLYANYISE